MTATLEPISTAGKPQPLNESSDAERRRDQRVIWMLTLAAGIARVATASRPGLWNDEAQTFRRVCGSFEELVGMLREAAFPPLHYCLYWLLGRILGGAEHLTPFFMRLVPALAGALMVPAMWALSRQLLGRRLALVVAAFTASSAYLFAYAHDAKMYMPLWMLVTVHVSFWIAWLRGGGRGKWIGWVVSGIAMVGYHATGAVVLAVELAHFVAAIRLDRRRMIAVACGLGLILLGPALYYGCFNNLAERSRSEGWHNASGLGWIRSLDEDNSWPAMRLAGSYLLAWEGTRNAGQDGIWDGRRLIAMALTGTFWVIVGAVVVGALCWRRAIWANGGSQTPNSGFATAFLLTFWLMVPLAGAYRLSGSPNSAMQGTTGAGAAVCFIVAAILALKLAWGPVRQWLQGSGASPVAVESIGALALVLLIAAVVWGVASYLAKAGGSTSIWIPRYLAFVWPAFAMLVCAALCQLRWRSVRIGAIAMLLGVNVAQCAALVLMDSEPPIGRMVADVYSAARSAGELRTWVPDDAPSGDGMTGGSIQNAVGRYYLSIATGNPLGPGGFTRSELGDFVEIHTWSTRADLLAQVREDSTLRRVIVWECLPSGAQESHPQELSGWRVVSQEYYPVRYHWNWATARIYRRAVYEHVAP